MATSEEEDYPDRATAGGETQSGFPAVAPGFIDNLAVVGAWGMDRAGAATVANAAGAAGARLIGARQGTDADQEMGRGRWSIMGWMSDGGASLAAEQAAAGHRLIDRYADDSAFLASATSTLEGEGAAKRARQAAAGSDGIDMASTWRWSSTLADGRGLGGGGGGSGILHGGGGDGGRSPNMMPRPRATTTAGELQAAADSAAALDRLQKSAVQSAFPTPAFSMSRMDDVMRSSAVHPGSCTGLSCSLARSELGCGRCFSRSCALAAAAEEQWDVEKSLHNAMQYTRGQFTIFNYRADVKAGAALYDALLGLRSTVDYHEATHFTFVRDRQAPGAIIPPYAAGHNGQDTRGDIAVVNGLVPGLGWEVGVSDQPPQNFTAPGLRLRSDEGSYHAAESDTWNEAVAAMRRTRVEEYAAKIPRGGRGLPEMAEVMRMIENSAEYFPLVGTELTRYASQYLDADPEQFLERHYWDGAEWKPVQYSPSLSEIEPGGSLMPWQRTAPRDRFHGDRQQEQRAAARQFEQAAALVVLGTAQAAAQATALMALRHVADHLSAASAPFTELCAMLGALQKGVPTTWSLRICRHPYASQEYADAYHDLVQEYRERCGLSPVAYLVNSLETTPVEGANGRGPLRYKYVCALPQCAALRALRGLVSGVHGLMSGGGLQSARLLPALCQFRVNYDIAGPCCADDGGPCCVSPRREALCKFRAGDDSPGPCCAWPHPTARCTCPDHEDGITAAKAMLVALAERDGQWSAFTPRNNFGGLFGGDGALSPYHSRIAQLPPHGEEDIDDVD